MLTVLTTIASSKWARYGLAVVVVVGAFWFYMHQHDSALRAQIAAQSQAAIAAQQQADNARVVAGLQEQLVAAQAQAARFATIRSSVNAAPHTTACARSPAVGAALDGLRGPSAGPSATRKGAR